MARGGYISMKAAKKQLFMLTCSDKEAEEFIAAALIHGIVSSRGMPQLERPTPPSRDREGKMILRDITQPRPVEFGKKRKIPSEFFRGLSPNDVAEWCWSDSYIFSLEISGGPYAYADVSLKEVEVNALRDALRTRRMMVTSHNQPKKNRRRDSTWEHWVAAVVVLAFKGELHGNLTQEQFNGLASNILNDWGLEEKELSTVRPTIREITYRLGQILPLPPAN